MSAICGGCQFMVEPGWETCTFCGHDLSAPPPPPPPPPPLAVLAGDVPPPPPGDAPPPPGQPSSPEGPPRGWSPGDNPAMVAVVAGVLVVVVLLAAVSVLGSSEPAGDGVASASESPMLTGDLVAVCNGTPAFGAGAYDPDAVGLPMIEVVAEREGEWSIVDPPEALDGPGVRPAASEVALVGCRRQAPTHQVHVCHYDENFLNMNIFWHDEVVELRVAATGELLAEGTASPSRTGCPGLLMIDDGPQVDHYPDAEAGRFLVANAGDGTRPDLPIAEQVGHLCEGLGDVTRLDGAPADPAGKVAVAVDVGKEWDDRSDLAGPRAAVGYDEATYVVCVGESEMMRDWEDQTCDIRYVTVVNVATGEVVTPDPLGPNPVEIAVCEPGLDSIGTGILTAAHLAPHANPGAPTPG